MNATKKNVVIKMYIGGLATARLILAVQSTVWLGCVLRPNRPRLEGQ